MSEAVKKEEVEELLGYEISERQFEEALKCAERKQAGIYARENRPIVLQHWYLVKLAEEYVRSLAFSRFTMDLCGTMRNTEKEHSVRDQSALGDNHILPSSAS